ncbi:hypothetical protein LAZ67_7000750, partial [Cordylochernes scorpioides]
MIFEPDGRIKRNIYKALLEGPGDGWHGDHRRVRPGEPGCRGGLVGQGGDPRRSGGGRNGSNSISIEPNGDRGEQTDSNYLLQCSQGTMPQSHDSVNGDRICRAGRETGQARTYSPDLCFVTKDQCDNPIQIAHKILTKFPKSQHCPSIYEMGIQIPQIDSAPIPRWNLGKANWEAFTKYIEDNINQIPPTPKNYSRASNLIISCAKKFIPRGHRKIYIPCWSPESERLYQEYNLSGNTETAENLIRSLDDSRKHRWHTMLEQMDFSKSSRKSWSLLRKLGGADPPHKHNQLTNPNKIATCISSKSRIHPNPSEKSRLKKVIGTNLSKSSTHPQLSTNIDLNEVEDAIKVTHNNRAPGPDGIMPEFMKHLGQKAIKWMAKLFTNILSTGSIPSVWKQAKVLAILKPGKTSDDPNNYRPISLLCIPYKILERIILNRISPIIEEYLPIEQAGFRPGRNCAEQTLALTTTIEDGFQKKLKTGAVFVDLTAAYDTVWREGLLYKLSKIINCKNIIKLINNFLTNRKITVHLNNKKSRPRTLNNGLPQGSVLAPLLFNVYTADIPPTNSQKFLYADDIALLHQEQSFSTLEQILNEDLKKLENFFSKWHLIPNPSKTVSSVFHLNNHKANRPLKLTFCNKPLNHDPCPKYLGVTLDRSLTFRQHLEKTRDKLKTRNNIMTRLAGTTWGCSADTLRTTALALVYSVAEYCAPVWERSSHTDSIDAQLNQTMRLITGNMRPTPIDWLPYLSNIAPPDLRRKKSTSNLLSKIKANTKLPINTVLEIPPPTRLISRNPAWVADENVDLKEEWRNRWSNLAIANKDLVEDPNTKPPGYNLPRRTWSTLNRIRTSTELTDHLSRTSTVEVDEGVLVWGIDAVLLGRLLAGILGVEVATAILAPVRGLAALKKTSQENFENQKHAKSPAGIKHANSAAAPDVTAPITAAATSAEPTSKNWCDSVEMEMGDEQNNGYTLVVRNKKRRRGSSTSEHAARQPSKPRVQHNTQQRKQLTGPRAMPPQQFKATRANIADAKARQTSSTQDNYIFVEVCPDISSYKYLQAIDKLVGGPRNLTQFNKMNGHYIVGLASKDLASRLLGSDLDIEGTLLKIFPYRKRAERIVVANLPGFVEDSAVVEALHPYGKVTSIAPILIKMGEYAFTDGRREAFILLHKDIKLENLPTRLDIKSKGDTLSAFLTFGIKCSKCNKQGHRRANCPALARQGNGNPRQAASPTDARPPPPPPPPPQQPRKPAPAPATPASPVKPATTSTEPQAIPSAHQPAEQMDVTHPAPAAHPASLAAPRASHLSARPRDETNAFHLGSGQDLCLGYSAVILAHPVAISGSGLACVFGPGVAVLRQRILWPGHIALATIDVHGEEMTAIAVHLAHEPRERNRQLELLAATATQEEEGACWIIGDFNIRDRGPSSSSSSDALAALLDLAALVDVATQFDAAHLPTRVARHGDQVESNRLDRILVPAGVLERVSIYATSHYHLSDHRLVLLQVGPPTTAVSSPTQPRLAAMSGLALEHLAGYIRELEEDAAHDDDDGTFWDRWTSIKAGLLAEARSLHDPRHAASDSYVYRARRYIAAQLEASSIRADYPLLPDLARAIRLRRPVSVIRDDDNNVIEGPELRRRAFATFRPRFARPTSDPAAGAAFIASSAPTTTCELSEEDPLHRPDISPSEIANAIEHLPRGKAPGWDGLPCELLVAFNEDFFAEALARVFAASRLRGALPPSTRRSSICLVPKARGGRGLDGYRPVALPSADYRVLAAILHRRLKPHLQTLVPECQTYAVPGRSPSWNIAKVTDAVEEATAMGSPLAVMGVDLESAFDSLDRGFLESQMTSLHFPPAFMGWINILYAGADATIRDGGFHTTAFPLLNGLRQGCAVSAALFSIATGPLLRRLELTLGVGNVIAYADDIVLLFHRDEEFERVATVLEDLKRASGIAVNLGKSAGLWCGAWRNRGDSPLGASWSTTSIRVLGLDIAPRSSVAHQEQHLLALLESACRRWTPFTRGLSLVGRARAANSLVGSTIQHHLHGYLPSPPTIAKLQARLARFVWGPEHTAWLPAAVMARPVAIGGLGLLDLATQLQLACLKGVQVALRGGRNGFDWLVASGSEAWIRPPPDGTRLQPRRLRLLKLWEEASKILSLNHRAVPASLLLDIPIIGGCRFLRPPDLLAPARWRGARVRDLLAEGHLTARPTRSALADAAALGAFCRRLTSENAVGFGAESAPSSSSLAAAVVLRGTATPFLNGLTTRSARRALDRPRLAATPISRFTSRWSPTIGPPPSRIDWASLRRCAHSGHEADAALKLALQALPHPAHPASVGPSCPACGSIDRSLGHRYWCCRSIRPLIREAFNIIGRPPDLQAWIFGGSGLEDDALSILASAKLRIYRYFVQ